MDKDYIKEVDKNAERRFMTAPVRIEKRAADDTADLYEIEGEAAVYNSTADIGWFTEEILPGAFDQVVNDDVRCLFNHDPNLILARSNQGQGTLKLVLSDTGLRYQYTTPDITYARDLQKSIELGNVDKSSFSFRVEEEIWHEREGQPDHRQIVKFSRLYDVAPVTFPAYNDTSVSKRSHDAFLAAKKEEKKEDQNTDPNKRVFTVRDAQLIINQNNI